jgi:alkylhydroperoxidase family enzyme
MTHPLLDVFCAAAVGQFPPVDGVVTFLPPLERGMQAVVSFTGHAFVASDVDPRDLDDLELDGFGTAVSPQVLLRIAMMLGSASEVAARTPDSGVEEELLRALAAWPTDPRFDPLERACLAFTEHFVMDVASLDDDTVAAVRAHLGDDGTQTFVSALLVVEQRIRLRLAWDVLMDER